MVVMLVFGNRTDIKPRALASGAEDRGSLCFIKYVYIETIIILYLERQKNKQ